MSGTMPLLGNLNLLLQRTYAMHLFDFPRTSAGELPETGHNKSAKTADGVRFGELEVYVVPT